jgi:putative two-component system response regulator
MRGGKPNEREITARQEFRILVIDDSPEILDSLSALLRHEHTVLAARSGLAGLDIAARRPQPHLILLDVVMPDLDGYAILARLKQCPLTREIPVALLTSLTDPASEEHAIELGACDFVAKPIRPNVLKARVRVQLEARQTRERLKARNDQLQSDASRCEADNGLIQVAAMRLLAHLAETRDNATGRHCERVQQFVWLLAELLCTHDRFKDTLTPAFIDLLLQSSPLHDIGKVGIPDRILLKNGPLDAQERAIMRTHAQLGSDAIEKVERDLKRSALFLSVIKQIARSHHERWDGGGYPDGLAGEAIPVAARLVALADVFDALISRRPYKEPVSPDEARDIIAEGRGVRFDPDVTDAFLANFDEFLAIVERYPELG